MRLSATSLCERRRSPVLPPPTIAPLPGLAAPVVPAAAPPPASPVSERFSPVSVALAARTSSPASTTAVPQKSSEQPFTARVSPSLSHRWWRVLRHCARLTGCRVQRGAPITRLLSARGTCKHHRTGTLAPPRVHTIHPCARDLCARMPFSALQNPRPRMLDSDPTASFALAMHRRVTAALRPHHSHRRSHHFTSFGDNVSSWCASCACPAHGSRPTRPSACLAALSSLVWSD